MTEFQSRLFPQDFAHPARGGFSIYPHGKETHKMADTQHTDTTEATDEAETPQAPGTDSAPAQETDWKAEARKWEDRAKANRAQVSQLKTRITELEGASGDLEKALARIGALEKHNADLEHASLVAEVATRKQVDPALLTGSTRQELEAYADRLLAWRGQATKPASGPLMGYQPSNEPKESPTKQVVRSLLPKE